MTQRDTRGSAQSPLRLSKLKPRFRKGKRGYQFAGPRGGWGAGHRAGLSLVHIWLRSGSAEDAYRKLIWARQRPPLHALREQRRRVGSASRTNHVAEGLGDTGGLSS